MRRGGVMCRVGVALVRIKCQVWGRAAMPHVGGCSGFAVVLQWMFCTAQSRTSACCAPWHIASF